MPRLIDADALIGPIKLQEESYRRCGAIERAEAYANCLWEIEQAPTVGGWISVKDRLPEEEEEVLVARFWVDEKNKKTCYVEIAERIGEDWLSDSDEYKICRHYDPYAWMPLPEPPKEESND